MEQETIAIRYSVFDWPVALIAPLLIPHSFNGIFHSRAFAFKNKLDFVFAFWVCFRNWIGLKIGE